MKAPTRSAATSWGLVVALAGIHATAFGDRFLTALLAAPLARDLHLSDTQLGLIQGSAFVALYVIATPLFGRLADRTSARRVILAGLAIWTAATFALSFCRSYSDLVWTRLALGVGEAALTPAALALIATEMAPGRLGRAMGVFTMGATFGKGAALFLGGALLAALTHRMGPGQAPWRLLARLFVAPNLLLCAILAVLPVRQTPRRTRPGLGEVLRHLGRTWAAQTRLLLAGGAVVVLSQSLIFWAPLFYSRGFGLPPATAGMAVGLATLVFAPTGGFLGGLTMDRLSRRGDDISMRLLGGALVAMGLAATVAFAAPALTLSIAGFALTLLALGAAAPISLVTLQGLAPPALRSSNASVYLAAVTLLGFGVGPPVIGALSDRLPGHLSKGGGHLGEALLIFVAVVCALGVSAALVRPARAEPGGLGAV